MNQLSNIDLTRAIVQNIMPSTAQTPVMDVLRLDRIHPVISGNKYFKLRYYIEEAMVEGSEGLATYGGPWSNHIVAVAEAARALNLKSMGYIRGEEPAAWSVTLKDAAAAGMQLHFLPRAAFREQKDTLANSNQSSWKIIPEGGAGSAGLRGAATIADLFEPTRYDLVACAVGTGTMMEGLLSAIGSSTRVMGVSVLKGEDSFSDVLRQRYPASAYEIVSGYHFGGYAKWNDDLIRFINNFYDSYGIGLDFVYTGKLFYAITQMMAMGRFKDCKRILIIHSGGLQGNRSMPTGTFRFD